MNFIKKPLIALLLALMTIGVADAQFRFGIKAGVNVNHLSTKADVLENNNRAGWTAGVMTEFQVPVIGLCFDASLMYQRLNSEKELDNKNFIDIPINIKFKFGLPIVGRFISPYIFTGPDFAFKLDKAVVKDFKTKTFQSAWNIGAGLELVKHLQISASYGFGMNNIIKIVDKNSNPVSLKNNYWTITAAYLF